MPADYYVTGLALHFVRGGGRCEGAKGEGRRDCKRGSWRGLGEGEAEDRQEDDIRGDKRGTGKETGGDDTRKGKR